MAAVLFMIPLFASRSVSALFKGGLSLMIAYLLYDLVKAPATVQQDSFLLFVLCAKEVFIGATIGFVVRLVFVSASMSGEIISLQAGLGFARFMDPYSQQQVSLLEQIKNLIALLVFFVIDAHHMLIKGIAYSLQELPIGAMSLNSSLAGFLVKATGEHLRVGLQDRPPIIVTDSFSWNWPSGCFRG